MDEQLLKKIRNTYKEVADINNEIIETQYDFAKILVEKDIKNNDLDSELKDMGIVYLTCHYLYLNYSKMKKTTWEKTVRDDAMGSLGKGYEASPYGQQYMLISNKKPPETAKTGKETSSGVLFL